ncbi:hypothetical protein MN116_007566 [Schistosoma mekongi]|uniref:Bromo domain-containing protein n=1 Tax=Schistosoma mekongi TaxID=38744 RepID=A0AAE1Z8E4_SCHME|nr:hypothetical protein MN116_007566 [Schistosoma mekongi]
MDSQENNPEVSLSWEILENLMSRQHAQVNYLFMDDPEPVKGITDNKTVGMVPVSLTRMNEKFLNGTYRGIREFVCDFRLMLLNCYRYNGISSRIGRCAEKLELLFEQKLQLLSPEIRAKASIQSTLGFGTAEDELLDCGVTRRRSSGRLFLSGDSRQLTPIRAIIEELEHVTHPGSGGGIAASLISNGIDSGNTVFCNQQQSNITTNNLSTDENIALIIGRLSLWERRRQEEELLDSWDEWWIQKNGPKLQEIVHNTPELLEAYQFLWLADPFLGISDCLTIYNNNANNNLIINTSNSINHSRSLSLFDLEIGLCSAPQASLVLNVCMSNLLATPKERSQIVAVLNNNSNNNCHLNVGADSSTESISFSTRRSRNLLSNTSTLPVIDYDIWERRLSSRIDSWYRSFWEKGKGVVGWATLRLGLSKGFFEACGYKRNPLANKRFHELSIYQQIVIICALCESTMRTFENLRLSLDKSADWEASNPVYLGTDFFSKHTYIHLPHLLGINATTSLRIYRITSIKCQSVEYDFKQVPKITINPNVDTYKTEILKDFLKLEESETTTHHQSTSNKRRRSCTKSKQEIQYFEELHKHNTTILENGLLIPGSVRRLPNWIHPSLARDIYRRLHCTTEQIAISATTVNSSTTEQNQEFEELNKGKKRRLSERNSNQSRTTDINNNNNSSATKVNTSNSRKRPRPSSNNDNSSNNNQVKENLPFANFQDIDNQIISEFFKGDPCLNPSPYASFNGPTRQFLSLQLSRTAIGGLRFCSKYSARRNKGVVNPNDDDNDEDDGDDDTESHSADQNVNDNRSPSLSHCGSDDEEDGDNVISRTVKTADKIREVNEGTSPITNCTNETSIPTRRSSRLNELSKKIPFDCSVNSNRAPSTILSLSDSHEHRNSEEPTEKSEHKSNQTLTDEQITNSELIYDKTSNEANNDDGDENLETTEENLVLEPSRESFTLIAKDAQELNQLLVILRQVLCTNEEKLNNMKHFDDSDLNLDSDCDDPEEIDNIMMNGTSVKSKHPSFQQQQLSMTTQQTVRLRNAIKSLKNLITNLEQLYQSVLNRENERSDAQRLARLRLRKDVQVWEANEAAKISKQLKMSQANEKNHQESRLNLLASLQTDTSKDRAERHLRREQLRAQDVTSDEACDESSEYDSESNEQNTGKPVNNSPKSITITIPTNTQTSSMKNINKNSYQAFVSRISASGTPKIPISRFNCQDLLPKIRRSAMLKPSKNAAILPRPSGQIKPVSAKRVTTVNNNNRIRVDYAYSHESNSIFRSSTPRTPAILRNCSVKTPSSTMNHSNDVSKLSPATSPSPMLSPPSIRTTVYTSSTSTASTSSTPSGKTLSTPVRKIYRVCNTLFTEDARPVKISPTGSLILIPPESIPLDQRQLASQMISRYHQHMNAISVKPNLTTTSCSSSISSPLTSSVTTVVSSSSSVITTGLSVTNSIVTSNLPKETNFPSSASSTSPLTSPVKS